VAKETAKAKEADVKLPPKTIIPGKGDSKGDGQTTKIALSSASLRRSKAADPDEPEPVAPPSVSAGPVDRVIELAFNPSRDKIREVTIVDRVQGRLFPQLDMINMMRHYCLEIACYRQDPDEYRRLFKKIRPVPPDPLDEFIFRTAQWQKSIAGKNLERATDIALAETEAKGGEDGDIANSVDAWKE
jgi:hypothetical protein